MSSQKFLMELSIEEKILIETIRKDPLLRKAIFRYFEAMSGISLKNKE